MSSSVWGPVQRHGGHWISLRDVLILGAQLLLLAGCQESLVYHPRPYPPALLDHDLCEVTFTTDLGPQICYLRRPHGSFHRLWILFNGNGGRARDWIGLVRSWPASDALLLIEYPGFGCSTGRPSPAHIQATTMSAIDQSAQMLGMDRAHLCRDCGVLGHSLGCAAALQCAAALPECGHVALLAPFTTLRAMARLEVGWPLCYVLMQQFDNLARLHDLAARPRPPRVGIASGDQDAVIPWRMGKELSTIVPGTTFWLMPGYDHQDILLALDMVVAGIE